MDVPDQTPAWTQPLARTALTVAAAVLLGGWSSAAILGLVSWSLFEVVAGFPLAYFGLPLAAVFLATYGRARTFAEQGARGVLEQALAGWIGFWVGSVPVLAVLPGNPGAWMGSLAALSLPALAMAGLAAAAHATLHRDDEQAPRGDVVVA